MNKRRRMIIITAIAIVIIAVGIGSAVLFMGVKSDNNLSTNDPQTEGSSEERPQSMEDEISTITNDDKLSNEEKLTKTIETMEEAKEKYQKEGNADKVAEISQNIEAIKRVLSDMKNNPPTSPQTNPGSNVNLATGSNPNSTSDKAPTPSPIPNSMPDKEN